jgi:hypothetical protein
MFVRPSVRMEELGSYWMDFHGICYLSSFWQSVEKIQVGVKSDKNNEYFKVTTFIVMYITIIVMYPELFLKWEMFQTKWWRKSKHAFFNDFFPENLAIF